MSDYIKCPRCQWIGTFDQCEDRPSGKWVGEKHKWCPSCGKVKTFIKVPAPVIYPVPDDLHELKAISIRQPWAWLIVHGPKRWENRDWKPSYPARVWLQTSLLHRAPIRVLIHAAQGMTVAEYVTAKRTALDAEFGKLPPFEELQRGGIIGVAEIVAWHNHPRRDDPWAFTGGFELARPQPLTFIRGKGALGFFKPDLSALESEVKV